MEGSGGEPGTESSAGFEWDADSQLYYHASTGFYHDPVAGWYYSSTDGQYYIYENGDYKLWTSDVGKEPKVHYPCDEASQGPELDSPQQPPPSEWMEETLINMYLSGYSNIEVNTENLLGDSQTNEEDRSEAAENKLSNLAQDNAPDSLNDATQQQIEDKMQTENTAVHESLGEEEEKWLSQYGQVERVNDDIPLLPSVDLWDWHMVTEPVSKGQPMARLVGRLTRGSSKLHPSLPARGGLLRTAPVIEVHLDLVRVSSGKLYRLRNPSRKHLASLSAYDSSNPTKDWGFPDIYATNNNSRKLSTAHCQPEVIDESSIGTSVSAASGKEYKINTYRDRAAERRILHRGLGIGPGQKQSNVISSDEYGETIETMDSMGAAPVDMNFRSSGLKSAKRIMENMGWKEGEALGKSRQGIVEPIHPAINKHGAGLGWNQTR
ncbi:uncharacterized protein LOC100838676 isoform X4 [Brachypodium distachyon]|uniref:G-patch domain-containing protein n=1 Tax=Brachypodium distachyon TaxID=15368 RepID=I1HCE5_BRADI|nr:uncharacterized protein LOC100838676 isoform X4 [Brachypodium distachyon]KQK02897.1 hypothetical protein BRADI_2g04317v3 [Brachypodium distachyon]KQK02898.1 hypothetical protein BRADI_2g04317v3 [Brachypodium distachyon]KQK02899.1 hypothetical protein BRADI_2g04317v3 [Brachypodium distachyon]PNT70036.1 hypothetical protein BRADI_2g04317v3 [Brachypodium distachyon]|eukprot:XP_024315339.1 uncharacterized protein LOC100838676 isoform X4 [Brachypodium distachyon]